MLAMNSGCEPEKSADDCRTRLTLAAPYLSTQRNAERNGVVAETG